MFLSHSHAGRFLLEVLGKFGVDVADVCLRIRVFACKHWFATTGVEQDASSEVCARHLPARCRQVRGVDIPQVLSKCKWTMNFPVRLTEPQMGCNETREEILGPGLGQPKDIVATLASMIFLAT